MSPRERATATDWALLAVAATLALLVALALPVIGASFAGLYADFGEPVPAYAQLATSWWPGPLAGALLIGACALAALASTRVVRRTVTALVIVAALAVGALGLAALYAPVFAIAGSIRRE